MRCSDLPDVLFDPVTVGIKAPSIEALKAPRAPMPQIAGNSSSEAKFPLIAAFGKGEGEVASHFGGNVSLACPPVRILVTGISGFVGSTLAPRLERDGHEVRGFARDRSRVQVEVPVVEGDAISGRGLAEALKGVEVAYYLIHSMEASSAASFAERELRCAENFAREARAAEVGRVVYLGGLLPAHQRPSAHLASRLAVEELLLGSVDEAVALRASIVIGAHSRSFRFLVRLVERLRVVPLPPWRDNRTAPIDQRDLIEMLAAAAWSPAVAGQSLDVAGPEILRYGKIIERIADLMLVGRAQLPLGLTVTAVASRVAAAIADEDAALIEPLMQGLGSDLLARDERAPTLLAVRRHTFAAAVEHALRDWESAEPLGAR